MWREKNKGLRNSESLGVFIVKDVNGGLVALPEVIVTISNRKTSLENKMNFIRYLNTDHVQFSSAQLSSVLTCGLLK